MAAIYFDHPLDDAARRRLIFGGALLVNHRSRATEALCNHAIRLVEEAFRPHPPETAQFSIGVDEFIARVGPLKTRFTNDPKSKELVRAVLEEAGCDTGETYFDVPRLRVVPHGEYLSSGVSYAYRAHRDTWYSSPTSQVNWWMPVFSVTAECAMSFFPEYWDKALKNNSSEFDYTEWCAIGRRAAVSQVKTDTRKHPLPAEEVSTASELRLAGTMGDVTLFSAAQLHSTAPNTSGRTRFSLDFRTVSLADLRARAGAHNVDARAIGTTIGDFLRASDFRPIEDILVFEVSHVG